MKRPKPRGFGTVPEKNPKILFIDTWESFFEERILALFTQVMYRPNGFDFSVLDSQLKVDPRYCWVSNLFVYKLVGQDSKEGIVYSDLINNEAMTGYILFKTYSSRIQVRVPFQIKDESLKALESSIAQRIQDRISDVVRYDGKKVSLDREGSLVTSFLLIKDGVGRFKISTETSKEDYKVIIKLFS
ncbi:MAG: hypothetical protein F6K53_20255 [Moorea sp. SIO4A1]|uniref:hypothetical protein n=1 Tax=Moorena sp. SIO4A1 TaxID=2607835 RepID=UPI00144C348C|nr:hypothetical protein [Moorena sp. SIO4A1]NEQ59605.1 hypothetical protein [Moorena sp. SIO4A1]